MSQASTVRRPADQSERTITRRTPGSHFRYIRPDGLARVVKPFVYFDLFDKDGPEMMFGLHPHSGIATVTHVFEGAIDYTDPDGSTGTVLPGGVEWMMAGKGMWHGGGAVEGHVAGFQLWVAMPPELELAPYESSYWQAEDIETDGPARVLMGQLGAARGKFASELPTTLLTVKLAAGESWRFTPPGGQDLLWIGVSRGALSAPDRIVTGELVIFDRSENGVTFKAETDTLFVLGASRLHDHELAIGHYSVHTSPTALVDGERYIQALGAEMRRQGRL